MTIELTLWPSLTEPKGKLVALTWEALAKALSVPKPRPVNVEKPELPGWSPAKFRDDRRAKDRVELVTALVLDVDKGSPAIETMRKVLAPWRAFVHSTRRTSLTSARWRIVMATTRPMTCDEHAVVWTWAKALFAVHGVALDDATKDPSRFWFMPCEPAEGDYVCEAFQGSVVDVDTVLAEAKLPDSTWSEPPESRPAIIAEVHDEPDELARITMSTRKRRASAYLLQAEPAVAGEQGHNVAMRVVTAVVRGFALSEADARDVLSSWNARCEPPWSDRELAHKISEAARVGALPWGKMLLETAKPEPKEEKPPESKRSPAPSPASRVRALAELGPVLRMPTTIATLDAACRGGLPTRRLVVLGGAPGAGKTTLATYWAWIWARHGIPVAYLAIDEGPEGVLMRIAQLEGMRAEAVEERDPDTLERLASLVDSTRLSIIDADDAEGTVEGAAALLEQYTADSPRVLIVDSIQTARAFGTSDAKDARERVDLVVAALKRAAVGMGILVIATCELARGAYRSRNSAENINDLAAFKESGGIEYAAQTALVLRSVPDEPDLIDVTVPKNRAYRKLPFRLHLDHASTVLTEVPVDEAETEEREEKKVATNAKRVKADADVLVDVLLRYPGIGERALRAEVRRRGHAWGKDRLDAAKHALGGRLTNRGTHARDVRWHLVSDVGGQDDDAA